MSQYIKDIIEAKISAAELRQELNAARMLLRSMVYPPDWENATQAGIRHNLVKDYLDACDTLEGK